MDTSNINASKVTTNGGIHLGEKSAPVKVIEFINLNCPFCKQWWEESAAVLDPYVADGKVERIVKLFDKEKPGLRKGNVIHHLLDYNDSVKTKEDIEYFLAQQQEWGKLEESAVAEYAMTKRSLTDQNNKTEAGRIITEASEANVTLVPSVFIGEFIFDEHITNEELTEMIETKLVRGN